MSHPSVQYPIAELPRDPDPASKINIADLKAWWELQEDLEHANGSLKDLINHVKSIWPATLPSESWYIALYSTLISCGKPATIAPIFKFLVRDASTEDEIKRLGDRFKDLLMKLWTIIGIVQPIVAFPHLGRAELAAVAALDPKADDDATRARLNEFLTFHTQTQDSRYRSVNTGPTVDQRGFDYMLRLYRHNLPDIMASWRRHQADVEWLEMRVIYGLFLSDVELLDAVESELVVSPAIMAQDVLAPTFWHVRGLQRLGVSQEDTDVVLNVIKLAAAWAGRELKDVANLAAKDVDVEWEPTTAK